MPKLKIFKGNDLLSIYVRRILTLPKQKLYPKTFSS